MSRILLDLNNPVFQQDLFVLPKAEALAVFKIFRKVSQLTWEQLYKDQGLKWELIRSKQGKNGEKLYSLRITQKCRVVAVREGDYLRFLSLHMTSPYADRIPAIAKVWGWHGGAAPTEYELLQVGAIPLWLPCLARSKRFIICVLRNISYDLVLRLLDGFPVSCLLVILLYISNNFSNRSVSFLNRRPM